MTTPIIITTLDEFGTVVSVFHGIINLILTIAL